MSFINVFISSPSSIGVKNNQLSVVNADGEHTFPLSDVDTVMIEDRRSTISAYAMSELAKTRAAVFFCDEKHLPTSVVLPIHAYCRPLAMLSLQTETSKPLKKQLWQAIVKRKIEGQARVLKYIGADGWAELEAMAKSVASDDAGNVEATAAAFYFKRLLDGQGRRNDEVFYNTGINYGYAIVRGIIARSLAASGFETSLGLHHCNTLNAFNLADDLIEPYRPYVDLWVYQNVSVATLNAATKKAIYSLVNGDVLIDGQHQTLSNAVDLTVQSLKRSLAENKACLALPAFEEAVPHAYA